MKRMQSNTAWILLLMPFLVRSAYESFSEFTSVLKCGAFFSEMWCVFYQDKDGGDMYAIPFILFGQIITHASLCSTPLTWCDWPRPRRQKQKDRLTGGARAQNLIWMNLKIWTQVATCLRFWQDTVMMATEFWFREMMGRCSCANIPRRTRSFFLAEVSYFPHCEPFVH